MRNLVTFILRLWIDPQTTPPTWEGRVECVADGEHAHVREVEDLAQFIAVHTVPLPVLHPEEDD